MPTIQQIMDKKKAFEDELKEFGKAALVEEFKKMFDVHAECIALRWRQYTPYFNDGNACAFGVHDFEMKLATTPNDDKQSDYGDEGFESTYGATTEERKKLVEAVRALARIDDDIYETVFGDHCRVTATRAGFDVEEYEHD